MATVTPGTPCHKQPRPDSIRDLPRESARGIDCCVCGRRLTTVAVPRGIVRGTVGVHNVDAEVWCCS